MIRKLDCDMKKRSARRTVAALDRLKSVKVGDSAPQCYAISTSIAAITGTALIELLIRLFPIDAKKSHRYFSAYSFNEKAVGSCAVLGNLLIIDL